jgi:methyltransferase (TIGR00027 family)
MTGFDRKAASSRGAISRLIFFFIVLLLLPVTVAGYVLWVARAYAARSSGVSRTAQGPLSARWFQHRLGMRRDEPANRLLMVLPGVSPLAVRMVFGPMLLAHRLTGYVPQTFRYPFDGEMSLQNQASARQTFYDSVVDRYLAGVQQFVILGACFDTRAFRLHEGTPVRSFEVDTPRTLAITQDVLRRAGVDPGGVTFVAADFEREDWLVRLVAAGFNTTRPALFVWEGVTPYLERDAVVDTLRKISGTAPGSVIAFDYVTTELLESQSLYFHVVRASLRAGGEPLKFGIDSTPPSSERLAELLRSYGLSLTEQNTLGAETGGRRAWGGLAIAVVR